MPTQDEVNRMNEALKRHADENARLWLSGTVDTNGMSDAEDITHISALRKDKKQATWSDFGIVDKTYEKSRVSPDDFNESDYEALAKRDPNGFGKQWREQKIEQIVVDFKAKNPDYLATEKNLDRVLRFIRSNQLKDEGCPLDDVMDAAFTADLWTVANLSKVFEHLVLKGVLDVPKGLVKKLSREDQLDVLALVRQGNIEGATIQYLEYSLGGSIPAKYRNDPRAFLKEHAELATDAAKWVFFNANATRIDTDDWMRFQKARLTGRQMLTYSVIAQAWSEWVSGRREIPETVETAPPAPAPKDPNTMTAEELEQAISQARRDAIHNR